jgi:hypothetical protein
MNVLIAGLFPFAVALIVHVFVWRLARPARGISVLLKLFAGVFAAVLAISLTQPQLLADLTPPGLFRAGLLYISLALAYVILFSAIDEDSPSTSIVKFAALAGEEGCPEEDLALLITDEIVAASRLESMVASGSVVREGDRYRLGPPGIFWNRFLGFFHRLYKLPLGG